MKPKAAKRMSHEEQRLKCRDFLLNFEDFDSNVIHDVFGRKKYMRLLVRPPLPSNKLPTRTATVWKSSSKTWRGTSARRTKSPSSTASAPTPSATSTSSPKSPRNSCLNARRPPTPKTYAPPHAGNPPQVREHPQGAAQGQPGAAEPLPAGQH